MRFSPGRWPDHTGTSRRYPFPSTHSTHCTRPKHARNHHSGQGACWRGAPAIGAILLLRCSDVQFLEPVPIPANMVISAKPIIIVMIIASPSTQYPAAPTRLLFPMQGPMRIARGRGDVSQRRSHAGTRLAQRGGDPGLPTTRRVPLSTGPLRQTSRHLRHTGDRGLSAKVTQSSTVYCGMRVFKVMELVTTPDS